MRKILIIISILFLNVIPFNLSSHPIQGEVVGHNMSVNITPALVQIKYICELPLFYISGVGYSDKKWAEIIQSNIVVELDSVRQKLNSIEWRVVQGEPLFKTLEMDFSVKVSEPSRHVLVISNAVLLSKRAVLKLSVSGVDVDLLDSNWSIEESWTNDESLRDLEIIYEPSKGNQFGNVSRETFQSTKSDTFDDIRWKERLKNTHGMEWIFLALFVFGWGALHSLSPGHGKSIAVAYLVGRKGKTKDAFNLAVITTVSHVFVILVFGLIVAFYSNAILIPKLMPYFEFISGGFILFIGLWLLLRRKKAHSHHSNKDKSILSLGLAGGMVPCPSAIVILLGALSLGKPIAGVILIVIFSLGLAVVLFLTGVLAIKGQGLIEDKIGDKINILPKISAILIIVIGSFIIFHSFY